MSSINDVAKEAGVSTATVSRTFSTPDLLNHQTRRRVIEAAQRLNYSPRRIQPEKALKRSGPTAGVGMPDALGFLFFGNELDGSSINEFYAPMLSGAQAEAGLLGMHMIIRMASRYTPSAEVPKMFLEQAVAGTLLVGAAIPEVLEAYAAYLPQSVLIDNLDETNRHDSILSDGFNGAFQATQYLMQLGHRRIGFLMNEPTAPSFQERRRGWLCALWEAGLAPSQNSLISVERFDSIAPQIEALLGSPDRPTAILAANDANALVLMKVCRTMGLRIPEDVSIIGYDDMPFSSHAYPPLTTVRVDKELMGRLAVQQLYARIRESQAPNIQPTSPVHITVPVSLVERESCCPPSL